MRSIVVLGIVGTIALGAPPAGAEMPPPMYYFEEGGRFGWAGQPPRAPFSGPTERRPGEDVWSYCTRQVGRTMRVDEGGLSRSTTMTDACVRRGGRM